MTARRLSTHSCTLGTRMLLRVACRSWRRLEPQSWVAEPATSSSGPCPLERRGCELRTLSFNRREPATSIAKSKLTTALARRVRRCSPGRDPAPGGLRAEFLVDFVRGRSPHGAGVGVDRQANDAAEEDVAEQPGIELALNGDVSGGVAGLFEGRGVLGLFEESVAAFQGDDCRRDRRCDGVAMLVADHDIGVGRRAFNGNVGWRPLTMEAQPTAEVRTARMASTARVVRVISIQSAPLPQILG